MSTPQHVLIPALCVGETRVLLLHAWKMMPPHDFAGREQACLDKQVT